MSAKLINLMYFSGQHLMAECGHTACSKCWLKWMEKSLTCPICRVDTTKESLARLVFEKEPGTVNPPSCSQLCPVPRADESSEEELELVK